MERLINREINQILKYELEDLGHIDGQIGFLKKIENYLDAYEKKHAFIKK